jgi:simple sugar transport system ATP-binding protein
MPLIELENISKQFDGIRALDSVSLAIEPGEVIGLVGDTGAGKTTLLKIIAGNFPPTSGIIRMDGKETIWRRPSEARARGIEVVYQDLALCDNLTAAENVFLGREIEKSVGPLRLVDTAAMHRRATELFHELKSETSSRQLVRTLSGGQRQAVALARARLSNPRLVLLDEPAAAISVRQIGELLAMIRRLRDQGVAVILVSHRLHDIFAVAQRIVVLRQGRKIEDARIERISPQEVMRLVTEPGLLS